MEDKAPLEKIVGESLRERGLTIATAESCTGGLLSHRITNIPGSSDYFLGGVVAYSYDAKEHILRVRHNTLYGFGAVSKEAAVEMARGVRHLFDSDIGIGITGIAGPGGGTPEKPVGLVYISLSVKGHTWYREHRWKGSRIENKEQSADAALRMILDYLDGRLAVEESI
jgi:PncC family amidohydrolase